MEIYLKATMYWLKSLFKAYLKGCALEKMVVFSNKNYNFYNLQCNNLS